MVGRHRRLRAAGRPDDRASGRWKALHPGAIILLHDAGGERQQTVEALPLIIKELRARGYELVTVPKLLADDPPPHGLPLPPNLSGD